MSEDPCLFTCHNCKQSVKYYDALSLNQGARHVCALCPDCQKAKKIRIVLVKDRNIWNFEQYYPVEGE